jgi:hypothetical protein
MRLLAPFFAAAVLALAYAAAPAGSSPTSASGCGDRAYTYAGFAGARRAHGVSAAITLLAAPEVANGHVAAWVGVGGPGEGPDGTDEWLQVGISGFSDHSALYYEVARPGAAPEYVEVLPTLAPGEHHRVTVLEMYRRPGWWRVFVDHRPVTAPIHLAGSHGRWHPIATAESWNGGTRVCNSFAYRFGRVRSASALGGGWKRFRTGYRFQDRGYKLIRVSRASFIARADF